MGLGLRLHQFGLLAALAALSVFAPARAAAQAAAQNNGGFALSRFDIAEVGSDWFVGDSLDLRGQVRPGVRLGIDWAHKPLVRYDDNGNEIATIIKDQVHANVGAALMLAT